MFATLQDRLPKELKLAGITTVEAANAFLRDVYLPAHNARFAVEPAAEGSAFTPIPGVDLDEILCVQEERQVGNDNCVSYRTLKLRNPRKPAAPALRQGAGQSARLPRRLARRLHGPRCIGRYDENGAIKDAKNAAELLWTAWTSLRLAHPAHRRTRTRRSGHSMCYQNWTT